jgi:hypothetical protein
MTTNPSDVGTHAWARNSPGVRPVHRNGQREFGSILASRGIPHEWHELPGAHFVRREMLQADVDGVVARLKKA